MNMKRMSVIEKYLAKGGEITHVPAQKTPKQSNYGDSRVVALTGQGSTVLSGMTGAAFNKKINKIRRST